MSRLRESPSYRRAEVDGQAAAYARDPQYRERKRARSLARHALGRGVIQRAPCPCGNPNAEMHHADYSKPLEVSWRCLACRRLEVHGPDLLPAPTDDPIAELLRRLDARKRLDRVA